MLMPKMEGRDEHLNSFLDNVRIVAPFAGSSLAVYWMLGGRVGPGRAFVLAFKSYFHRSANPSSVRTSVAARIQK